MIMLAHVNMMMKERPHDWGRLSCCNESVTMRKVLITVILINITATLFRPFNYSCLPANTLPISQYRCK
jgi:hypothetical protein